MKRFAFLLLPAVLACGTLVPPAATGLRVECHTVHSRCYSTKEVENVVAHVAAKEDFDTSAMLVVQVYDRDYRWAPQSCGEGSTCHPAAVTWDGTTTAITNLHVLTHELFHILYFRNTGDGDLNHGAAPGPWIRATDTEIDEINQQIQDLP